MAASKKWTIQQLRIVVKKSHSIREVIQSLGLVPAGGNYQQIKKAISENKIDIQHFSGQGWRKNKSFPYQPRAALNDLLVKNSAVQSFKLKKRLFHAGLKKPQCEICGWAEQAENGRIPVELDHVNGDRYDNRLHNLRILCPNCHSLQSTHRGLNKGKR